MPNLNIRYSLCAAPPFSKYVTHIYHVLISLFSHSVPKVFLFSPHFP